MSFISESLRLTAWGMGLVFLVLAGLWAIIALLVRFDAEPERAAADEPAADATRAVPAPLDARATIDPRLLAAIMIAVRAHIRVRRKQAAPAMRAHAPGSLPSRWTSIGRGRQVRGG
jgi:Na+-transporting methylmalonyl-CoA/oxaloacetate decarboxylase gamma subunit